MVGLRWMKSLQSPLLAPARGAGRELSLKVNMRNFQTSA